MTFSDSNFSSFTKLSIFLYWLSSKTILHFAKDSQQVCERRILYKAHPGKNNTNWNI